VGQYISKYWVTWLMVIVLLVVAWTIMYTYIKPFRDFFNRFGRGGSVGAMAVGTAMLLAGAATGNAVLMATGTAVLASGFMMAIVQRVVHEMTKVRDITEVTEGWDRMKAVKDTATLAKMEAIEADMKSTDTAVKHAALASFSSISRAGQAQADQGWLGPIRRLWQGNPDAMLNGTEDTKGGILFDAEQLIVALEQYDADKTDKEFELDIRRRLDRNQGMRQEEVTAAGVAVPAD
jgi:hypothetical protein